MPGLVVKRHERWIPAVVVAAICGFRIDKLLPGTDDFLGYAPLVLARKIVIGREKPYRSRTRGQCAGIAVRRYADEREQILLCFFDVTDRTHGFELTGSLTVLEGTGRKNRSFKATETGLRERPSVPL